MSTTAEEHYGPLRSSELAVRLNEDESDVSMIETTQPKRTSFQVSSNTLVASVGSRPSTWSHQASEYLNNKKATFYNAVIDRKTAITGIIIMLFSAFLFSLLIVLIKYGNDQYNYSSSQLLMTRGIIQTIIVSILLCIKKYKQTQNDKQLKNDKIPPMLSKQTLSINSDIPSNNNNNNNNNNYNRNTDCMNDSDFNDQDISDDNYYNNLYSNTTPKSIIMEDIITTTESDINLNCNDYDYDNINNNNNHEMIENIIHNKENNNYNSKYNYNNKRLSRRESIGDLWQNKIKLLWLILRGIFGACSGILYFESVTLIPIGDAIATFSLYPIFTCFIAYFLLQEKLQTIHGVALVFAIGGGLLESQPQFIFNTSSSNGSDSNSNSSNSDEYNEIGYICAIIGAIFAGFEFVSMRKLKHFDKNYLVLSYSVHCIIFGIIFAYVLYPRGLKLPNNNQIDESNLESYLLEWGVLIGIGIVGYLANVTMTYSAQLIQSGLSSLLRSTDTLFSYIFQIVLFNEIPSMLTASGGVMIMVSVALVSLAKYQQAVQSDKERVKNAKHPPSTKIVLM